MLKSAQHFTSYTGIVHHPRFKAYFNTRLHVALAAGDVLTPEGFVPLLDEHRQALYPIVSADVARWLAEPNASGNPTLADYGPKRWLSETNQLRQTGAGSWFLNNRKNYTPLRNIFGFCAYNLITSDVCIAYVV
jgi:hypothetical protein